MVAMGFLSAVLMLGPMMVPGPNVDGQQNPAVSRVNFEITAKYLEPGGDTYVVLNTHGMVRDGTKRIVSSTRSAVRPALPRSSKQLQRNCRHSWKHTVSSAAGVWVRAQYLWVAE